MITKRFLFRFLAMMILFVVTERAKADERWSPAQAKAWYAEQPWLLGANFVPADAINQLEMWQETTFDAAEIDRELGWAQALGMNTVRVFLHDQLWQQDAPGFKRRIDTFLTIAVRYGIRPIFVLFDSCWDPNPHLGPQHPPLPGVHNSGWVQGPGKAALEDSAQYPRLEAYVRDIVGTFGQDTRVLAWDVWNEPKGEDIDRIAILLPQVFDWARAENPTQPLTSGIHSGDDWSMTDKLGPIQAIQIANSDILTFHDYDWPEKFENRIIQLSKYGRPIICTEYMARSIGSTIDGDLPIAKKLNVGMINWGLVTGKTQTNLPWDSWEHPYVQHPPAVWFHDLLKPDGAPYREREAEILRDLSGRGNVGAAH
jgi:hypothetical protein